MSTVSKVKGVIEMIFIRGGVGQKSNKKYLFLSNGRKELFVNVDEKVDVSSFQKYEEDDIIKLEVELTPGSDQITVLDIVE